MEAAVFTSAVIDNLIQVYTTNSWRFEQRLEHFKVFSQEEGLALPLMLARRMKEIVETAIEERTTQDHVDAILIGRMMIKEAPESFGPFETLDPAPNDDQPGQRWFEGREWIATFFAATEELEGTDARRTQEKGANGRIQPLKSALDAIRHAITSLVDRREIALVTLSQAAAIVKKSKRTLQDFTKKRSSPSGWHLPEPAVNGGGGKAALYRWPEMQKFLIDMWPEHQNAIESFDPGR